MIPISNCSCLKLTPVNFLRPLTAMSDRLRLEELKYSATRKPQDGVHLDALKIFTESFL